MLDYTGKFLPGANTLAYLASSSATKKKSFVTLAPDLLLDRQVHQCKTSRSLRSWTVYRGVSRSGEALFEYEGPKRVRFPIRYSLNTRVQRVWANSKWCECCETFHYHRCFRNNSVFMSLVSPLSLAKYLSVRPLGWGTVTFGWGTVTLG
jgi:hypothetical protein